MKKKRTSKPTRKTEDAALAEQYRCTPRTVARWRADDAPLDDPPKMRAWLAGRKNLPPGTLELLIEQRRTERAAQAQTVASTPPDRTGAAAALVRLEQAEEQAHRAMREAERAGDPLETRLALKRWLTVADQLLSFDHRVQASRRVNDLVPKDQAEAAFRNVGLAIKLALPAAFERATPLVQCADLQQIHKTLRGIGESLAASVVSVGIGAPKIELPSWAAEALTGGADFLGKSWPPERIEATQRAGQALFEMTAAQWQAEADAMREMLASGTEDEVRDFRAWRARQQQEQAAKRAEWCRSRAAEGLPVPDASDVEMAATPGLKRG